MIRLTLLGLYVLGFSAYAFKDWFKSLCALIILMAVIEHPDMPKTILGIQGLNPWNLLLVAVVAGWARARKAEGLTWDMPRRVNLLLLLYLGVVLIAFARMAASPGLLDESLPSLVSEYLVNTLKWVVPALLLFDGARTRPRLLLGLAALLGVYFLLGVQVIKWMPLSYALDSDSLSSRSLKILQNEIGYHRVNISAMLAGASWAIFATRPLALANWQRVALIGATVAVAYAQALTAGRAGYVTWAAVGLILCSMRWRKYLLGVPVLIIAVAVLAPGVTQRMLEGFTASTRDVNVRLEQGGGSDSGPDAYTITAGRTVIWPFVIRKITQAPLFGYGREAMVRTGLTQYLFVNLGEAFGHPHNAYLELLLDSGLFGFLLVLPFYFVIVKKSISLFMDARHPVFTSVGGVSSALVLALLLAGTGSQTFYPREGWLPMWCAIGLMLRVYVERARWMAAEPGDTAMASTAVAVAAVAARAQFRRPAAFSTVGRATARRAAAGRGIARPAPERPLLFDWPAVTTPQTSTRDSPRGARPQLTRTGGPAPVLPEPIAGTSSPRAERVARARAGALREGTVTWRRHGR